VDPVAAYAAVVASGTLGWQVYQWHHSHKDHVEVKAAIALMGLGDDSMVEAVAVIATNRSDHTIHVEGLGLDIQDGSDRELHVMKAMPGATLPGAVEPHNGGSAYIDQREVEAQGISVFKPVTAWVRLATGEVVRSKPRPLLKRD
jgi:predicted metal-dependent phosphoesterase TrpH